METIYVKEAEMAQILNVPTLIGTEQLKIKDALRFHADIDIQVDEVLASMNTVRGKQMREPKIIYIPEKVWFQLADTQKAHNLTMLGMLLGGGGFLPVILQYLVRMDLTQFWKGTTNKVTISELKESTAFTVDVLKVNNTSILTAPITANSDINGKAVVDIPVPAVFTDPDVEVEVTQLIVTKAMYPLFRKDITMKYRLIIPVV